MIVFSELPGSRRGKSNRLGRAAAVLAALLLSTSAFAERNAAIVEFRLTGVSEQDGVLVRGKLESILVTDAGLALVERSKLDRILKEQAIQATGITRAEDAVRMGQILNAHFLITSELAKSGRDWTLLVKVINSENGKTLAAETIRGREIDDLIESMSEKLPDALEGLATLENYFPGFVESDRSIRVTQTQRGDRFEFVLEMKSASSGDTADFSVERIDAGFFSRLEIAADAPPAGIAVQFVTDKNKKSKVVQLSSILARNGVYELPMSAFDLDEHSTYHRIRIVLSKDTSAVWRISRMEMVP